MRAHLGCATAIFVAAGATIAAAQTTVIERTTPSVIARDRIELSPAQRTSIYRSVTRERVRSASPGIDVRLGARVPQTVVLEEIPSAVIADLPTLRRYRTMVINDEVVLVDPATNEIVEIIRQ